MACAIDTKFGRATLLSNGYYQITSRKEGNHLKMLHRLIFEDFYQINIEKEFPNQKMVVHHIDENKTNNDISNLDIMTVTEHRKLHTTGENNPNYGKPMPMETRQKIREGNLSKTQTEKAKLQMSKNKNTSGFFRVCKQKDKTCKQGFLWAYRYYITPTKRKLINRTNLQDLMEKIISEGLPWMVIDEENAKQTCEQYGYDFNKLNNEVN